MYVDSVILLWDKAIWKYHVIKNTVLCESSPPVIIIMGKCCVWLSEYNGRKARVHNSEEDNLKEVIPGGSSTLS